jgi:hypothetical protein
MMSTLPHDMGRAPASSMSAGLIGIALAGCTSSTLPMTSGQTTTTYGTDSYTSSNDDDCEFGCDGSSEDALPEDGSTSEDPSDTDPSDTGPSDTGPSDTGPFFDMAIPDGFPDGWSCTSDFECMSGNCYVIPFLGGYCGQCNDDSDCFGGGCTPPNPFVGTAPFCNMGEPGAGCESDDACAGDLSCATAMDLLGLIQINGCSPCLSDDECGDQICAAIVSLPEFSGQLDCIDPQSLPQNAYCDLESNGNEACASGICSVIDVMGLAELGACGQCNVDADCNGGFCVPGEFLLDTAELTGSTCQ